MNIANRSTSASRSHDRRDAFVGPNPRAFGTRIAAHLLALFMLLTSGLAIAQTYPNPLVNTASVTPPTGVSNSGAACTAAGGTFNATTGACSATDSNALALSADMSVVKSQRLLPGGAFQTTPLTVTFGQQVEYRLVITNNGPSLVTGATFSDPVPANFTVGAVTPTGGAGATACTATPAGNNVTGSMTGPSGATCTVLITATAQSPTGGAGATNTATVAVPTGTTDPTAGNNTSSVNTIVNPTIDAVNDAQAVVPAAGGTVPNVVANDTTNGVAAVIGTNVSAPTITANGGIAGLTANPDGTLTVPAGTAPGAYTATYQICTLPATTPATCDTATVPIVVGPDAVNDTATTPQNTPLNANAATNDVFPAGSTFTATSAPANGTVTMNPDGTYTYTPNTNFNGTDTFTYQVCLPAPNGTVCDTATVTVTITAATIDAINDNATTAFGTPVTTNVVANDVATGTGAAVDPASVTITTPSPNGTTTVNTATGEVTFTPNAGFTGTTTYSYQVCLTTPNGTVCDIATVTVVVGPDAVNDTATTPQNTPVNGNVSTNDVFPPGSTFSLTTAPTNGTVVLNADGTYTYTPNAGFSGTDTFNYQVCLPAPNATVCDVATVTITVAPNTVTANDDTATTPQNTPVTTPVLGNDTVSPGGAPLNPASVTITTPSPNGTTTVDPATGNITFTPNPNFSGTTTYSYQVCDTSVPTPICDTATVTVTVAPNVVTAVDDTATTPQNTPVTTPVLGNDTVSAGGAPLDPASVTITTPSPNGTTTVDPATGNVTFTPNPNFSGTTTYSYQVCDTSSPTPICDTAVVTVTVAPNVVTAVDDTATTPQNTPVTTPVLGNDTVSAGGAPLDPASVTITTPSPNGTTTVDPATGNVTFTPNAGFSGTTTYSYQVCDTSTPTPICDTATVTVTVAPNVVTAVDDTATTPQNTPVTTPVLGNDTVTPGGAPLDPASVTVTTPSPNGTTTVDPATGNITFTPAPNFSGTTTYTYQVCDTSNPTPICDTAVVTVTVAPNTVTANDDTANTPQNTPVTTPVLGNDTVSTGGAPLDPASVTITTPSPNGTTTVDPATGNVTFTPAPGFSGTTTYTYQVCDTSAPTPICDTAVVTVTVAPNTVTANDDTANTPQNTPVTTTVLANDTVTPGGAPLDPASVTVTTPSPNGTTSVDPATGNITFTPNAGFSGTTTYSYQVCDTSNPTPICDTAVVAVTVAPNVVDAVDDASTTAQNTPVTTAVLGNDTVSAGGAPLNPASVTITTPSPNGTTSVDPATGNVTFTPSPNFSGTTTYSYQVCDTSNPTPICDIAVVTITVTANVLTAVDDTANTPQNTPVTTPVLANDTTNPGGAPLDPASVTITTPSPNGTTTVDPATGNVTFTPNTGFSGTTTYTYQVCDTSTPTPVCDTAVVTVTVAPNTVTANDDVANTPQNTPVTTPVLGNDTVTPGGAPLDPASVTVTTPSPNGTTSVDPATGNITFTPNPNFSGTTTYTYQVCDTSNPTPICDTATVTVTIAPNTVDAVDDTATTPQNTPVTTPVIGNDTVSSGGAPLNPASVTITTPSPNGTTTVDPATGNVTFTPNTGFSGTTTYSYQVCDTSTPTPICDIATVTVTVAPNTVTANDDTATTPQNTPVTTPVLGNDTVTPGGAPLDPGSVTITTPSPNGTTTVDPATGNITFTPNPNFSGTTTYTYQVCDTSNPTPVCDTATVTVTVAPNTVTANDDTATTPQNTPVTTPVLGNDTVSTGGAPLDPASVTITTPSPNGTTTVDPATGNVTFTPNTGFSGTTTYSYQVCDTSTPTPICDTATVTVTVAPNTVTANDDTATTPQNTPVTTPVLGNDTVTPGGAPLDPASVTITTPSPNGTTTVDPATGNVTFTPNPGFSGTTTYTYQVCDTSNPTPVCDTATVTVTVAPNTVTANDDTATTPQNTPVSTPVLGNDTVTPGGAPLDPASVTVTTPSPNGTTTVDPATGTITFTPNPNFSGTTTYTYQVCDTSNPTPICDTATVTVTVAPNTVDAVDDTATTPQNTPVTTPVLGNDTVSSGGAPLDPASVTITTPSPNGTTTVDPATGNVTFTPNTGFSGTTTYSYQVCDTSTPTPICDTATVTVTVQPNVVTATDDTVTTPQNTPVVTPVLGNDTVTPGGAPLDPGSVTITTPSPNGTTTVDPATGNITFTPTPGFSGTTTYTYQVCDTSNPTPVCDTATVTVTVSPNVVTANDDTANTPQNTPVTTPVLGNDTVSSGGQPLDPASVTVTTPSPNGTTTVDPATGNITFTPTTGFSGTTTYTYQVCDTSNPTPVCDTATVTVTVAPAVIDAQDDNYSSTPVNGTNGNPNLGSVFVNDTANGGPIDLAFMTLIVNDPNPGDGVSISATGVVSVAPGTAAGTYVIPYQICETQQPTNCDTANVTVVVDAAPIDAIDDVVATPVNGGTGGTNVINVLLNDTLNGAPVNPADVVVTPVTTGPLTVNADGSVNVAPNTAAGTYTVQYQLCEVLNPTNCDTATVTVTVVAPTITASDDPAGGTGTTPQNTPVTTNVLTNDTLNGGPIDPTTVNITVPTPPTNGTVTVNPDGTIVYTPNPNFSGTDSYTYTICEKINPTNCATATVTVTVQPNVVTAINDTAQTDQGTPVTINVIGNDTVTGAPLDPNSLTITTPPANGNVVCNAGQCTYTPNELFSGTDTFTYRVCDRSVPTPVCSTATVTITVVPNAPVLRLVKQAGTREVKIGDLVRYTVIAENVGDSAAVNATLVDTPPAGFTYVADSFTVDDENDQAVLTGTNPLRVSGIDVAVGGRAVITYFLRVGAGVGKGSHKNSVSALDSRGNTISNVATAEVQVTADPLLEESLILGSVFDDRDGDGWQDAAKATGVRVQGGFAPGAYVANSTTVDRGNGPQPEPDASSPLLHGIAIGTVAGRASTADVAQRHQVVVRQVLTSTDFSDDFVLTTDEGTTLRMNAAGETTVERSRGDAAKGLTAQDLQVTRHVSQTGAGYEVAYVIRNNGIEERGIPGVRIASVEGLIMETDQFGRYHLVGIDGGDIGNGRNFILKVDPATLPAGSQFTTENPRVRRITQGIPVRFDFGVKLPPGDVGGGKSDTDVELGEVIFEAGSAKVKSSYVPMFEDIAGKLRDADGGSVTVTAKAEEEALAFARARAVQAELMRQLEPELAAKVQVDVVAGTDASQPLVRLDPTIKLGELLFDTAKWTIRPQYRPLIKEIANALNEQGHGVVGVVGRADPRGGTHYNAELGLKRAKAVYEAISAELKPEVRQKVRVDITDDTDAPVGVGDR